MKLQFIPILALTITMLSSCGKKPEPPRMRNQPLTSERNAPGDSTLYGLACDGSSDSVIVILPNAGGDPVTYSTIVAMTNHQVYGMPKIGDQIGIILSKDKKSADRVYDMNEMLGKWCYKVIPTLNRMPGLNQKQMEKMTLSMPDSIKNKFIKPVEYGFELNSDKSASSVGHRKKPSTDNFSPVTYPKQKRYTSWRLYNGRIILAAEPHFPSKKEMNKASYDTAEIVMLRKDSLVLKFKDGIKGYYRKTAHQKS
jgi:hypothetical protein